MFSIFVMCHQAKQTRSPLPITFHKSIEHFPLINFEIWGPYSTLTYRGASYFPT